MKKSTASIVRRLASDLATRLLAQIVQASTTSIAADRAYPRRQ